MKTHHDIITMQIEILHQTEKAWLFDTGEVDKITNKPIGVWVPKSQCEYDEESEELQIPEKLALEKGLI